MKKMKKEEKRKKEKKRKRKINKGREEVRFGGVVNHPLLLSLRRFYRHF